MASPTFIDEEDNVKTLYYSCPVRFIPDSVWSFLKYRYYHERHPSVPFPSLDDLSPRYAMAEAQYDGYLSTYMLETR